MALITTLVENPTQITQAQVDEIKDALVDGLLEINTSGLRIGGTAITATPAELNYVDGVTSAIQTQLNSKLETVSASDIDASTLVIESEGISANDNDTTIPTSAAVKDYVDTTVIADTTLTQEEVEDIVGGMVSGNTETNITVTYQDIDGTLDFEVPNATLSGRGVVELATDAETIIGTDGTRAATPLGIKNAGYIKGITAEPIADLSDVTITTVADNEVLAYNSGTSTWINQTAAEAGLATSSHTHTHVDITDFDSEVQALSINNLSEDTTPSLGGTLDATDNDIQNIKLAEFQDEHDNGNSGTSDTIDWGAGNNQKSTLTGNVTYSFTAPSGPSRLQLRIIQDATGSRTVTWPASVKWPSGTAPTLSTAANAEDIVTLFYNGTDYYGVFTGGMA